MLVIAKGERLIGGILFGIWAIVVIIILLVFGII